MGDMDGKKLYITVTLPVPVSTFVDIINAVSKHFPEAELNTSHPAGWHIEVGPLP